MDRLNILELIQLYTAGCISQPNKIVLKALMESDENFPWIELAESQNLIAILTSALDPETPSGRVKEKIMMKLDNKIIDEELTLSQNKVLQDEPVLIEEQENKYESNSKIDWGTLSVLKTSPEELNTPEKVVVQDPVIRNEPEKVHLSDTSSDLDFEQVNTTPEEPIIIKSKERFSALQGTRKYVLIFALVFVLAVIVYSYFNLVATSDNNYIEPKVNKPVNVSIAEEESAVIDSSEGLIIPENIQLVEEETTQTKEQTIKEVLPTPPPELPAPIETPVTQFAENNSVEEDLEQKGLTESNEPTVIPSKEVTEIEEEPAYFVAVEEMPEPIGGLKSIQEKIIYPEIAIRAGVQGKVFVRAFVDESGSVTKAEVVKGIGAGCDEAAIDAVLQTKFSPGKQRGRPIKVQITVPIVFKL
ncbi:MAG: energy transducer TonB [Ignavibacteriaceae bacterium]|nr:energy transducer TonB [Ignavibacteriaceae bacterium]